MAFQWMNLQIQLNFESPNLFLPRQAEDHIDHCKKETACNTRGKDNQVVFTSGDELLLTQQNDLQCHYSDRRNHVHPCTWNYSCQEELANCTWWESKRLLQIETKLCSPSLKLSREVSFKREVIIIIIQFQLMVEGMGGLSNLMAWLSMLQRLKFYII